jgi:hypothetical protein
MTDQQRVCIAYIAGRLVSGRPSTNVYDHAAQRYFSFSGTFSGTDVQIYDHTRRSHISGNLKSGTLYDHEAQTHLQLQITGNDFTGYDHASGTHFSGQVRGSAIQLYDNGEYFHYQV